MSHLPYKAVILDMDGVLTNTSSLHCSAFKKIFNELLQKKLGSGYVPFDEEDYKRYLAGMPRYKGIRSFIESRNLNLPEGNAADTPDQDTIYGLGKRKNDYFHKLLAEEGVEVFGDALQMMGRWRQLGVPMALVSSSRNAEEVLHAGGVLDFFDIRIDGQTTEERGLNGKPDPDTFLAASRELGVAPEKAIVFEDARAGVAAGKKGGFGWVVGVARNGEDRELEEAGADIIVHKLTELDNFMQNQATPREAHELPHALQSRQEIEKKLQGYTPVLFLDYDGTLSPIVKDPEKAILSDEMRSILSKLAEKVTVAVVSGRDRADVQKKVGLENVVYAGSHGFDIEGPNGLELQYEGGQAAQPALDDATRSLNNKIGSIAGVQIERKKYAIAVHYRNVADEQVEAVIQAVEDELSRQEKLKGGGGKKIKELKPKIDWHKGRATEWLMEKLNLKGEKVLPVFIGDDLTDEDGLKAVHEKGIGIIAGEHGEKTWAHYRVEDVEEVQQFLQQLNTTLDSRK
ncbi:trehalose-phosphatase [Cesiribacter sp. SM1]|uniref:trehalose-phosphatase n=1 Tax=Cesiribacter sp. SM1 TaxID=2861196 RepID=UPI001CD68A7D|nr:trehalose-phosphatase [Cesiribacter sp. SM1]